MGMFDHYQPEPPLVFDGVVLSGWQGKAGPCALYVWRQHSAAPVEQAMDEEWRGLPEVMASSRLPEGEEVIYTSHPRGSGLIFATIIVRDGVWTDTKLKNESEEAEL